MKIQYVISIVVILILVLIYLFIMNKHYKDKYRTLKSQLEQKDTSLATNKHMKEHIAQLDKTVNTMLNLLSKNPIAYVNGRFRETYELRQRKRVIVRVRVNLLTEKVATRKNVEGTLYYQLGEDAYINANSLQHIAESLLIVDGYTSNVILSLIEKQTLSTKDIKAIENGNKKA